VVFLGKAQATNSRSQIPRRLDVKVVVFETWNLGPGIWDYEF
jgi:hypothetical protein